ncbi:MAG TPA: hypothetical protein VF411_12390 [Bacteroidia bacterium]
MTTIDEILPKELKAQLDSLDYQEDGGILITWVNFLDNNLKVNFTLSFGGIDRPKQFWNIEVTEIEKEKIVIEWANYPEIYSDHFLLYDFTDNYIELYFNGKTDNPEKLLIDLYKSHITNYNNDLEFGLGINAPNGMLKLCTNDSGLFARGPKRILREYEKCLISNGVKTNYINEIESDKKNLKLLIFGDSYFIAKDFKFSLGG